MFFRIFFLCLVVFSTSFAAERFYLSGSLVHRNMAVDLPSTHHFYYGFQAGYESLRWNERYIGIDFERAIGAHKDHIDRYHGRYGYLMGISLPLPMTIAPFATLDIYDLINHTGQKDKRLETRSAFAGCGVKAMVTIPPSIDIGLSFRILYPFYKQEKDRSDAPISRFGKDKGKTMVEIETPIRFYLPFVKLCDISLVPFYRTEKFGKKFKIDSKDLGARIEFAFYL